MEAPDKKAAEMQVKHHVWMFLTCSMFIFRGAGIFCVCHPLVTLRILRSLPQPSACRIALAVAQREFWYSKGSCARILTTRSFLESLGRDLAMGASYNRDLVKGALIEILHRDLSRRPVVEILYGDLVKRAEVSWRSCIGSLTHGSCSAAPAENLAHDLQERSSQRELLELTWHFRS